MKILLLSRYSRLGASSRLRCYQYLPYLKDQGIEVTVASLLGDEYIKNLYAGRRVDLLSVFGAYVRRIGGLLKSNRFDLLWIQYEILPWLPAWAEEILAHFGIPYVVDYDDAVFHSYDMHQWRMVRRILGDKIDKVMHRAALVIAGNKYLADRARRAGAGWIECLPTVVDLERYHPKPHRKKHVVNFGWIGSLTTAKYLYFVTNALARVCSDINARLVIVGSRQVRLDGVPAEVRTWSEETEVENIQDFDVGIMPMPDDPWTRGKCGYKLIQYMACGRPVVASPVGVNQQIVEDGVNGFSAVTVSDWVRALKTLGNDYELRDHMGKAARAKVESQYSLQVTAPRLADLLRSLVGEFE